MDGGGIISSGEDGIVNSSLGKEGVRGDLVNPKVRSLPKSR